MAVEILNSRPKIFRAVRLEFLMPREARLKILRLFFILSLLSGFLVVFSWVLNFSLFAPLFKVSPYLLNFILLKTRFLGAFLFSFSMAWLFFMLDFYFLANSRPVAFFSLTRGKTSDVKSPKTSDVEERVFFLDFGGARRLFYLKTLFSDKVNLARLYDFYHESNFMKLLMLRLGIAGGEFEIFLSSRAGAGSLEISRNELFENLVSEAEKSNSDTIGAREFIMLLFSRDEAFKKFLFDRKIREPELRGAVSWAAGALENKRKHDRWWEQDVLGRVQGIGKDLGYGFTYTLDQYSSPISGTTKLRFLAHQKEVLAIEDVLSRSGQPNVILVGEEGSGKRTILEALAHMIFEGNVRPALEYKRLISLDTAGLTAATKNKGALEELLIKIMNDAVSAGNIILAIDNFASFLDSAEKLGVDAVSILEPYIAGPYIQVIALSDAESFHGALEQNGKLSKLFEKIEVKEPALAETVTILEDAAEVLERRSGIIVTYQAAKSAADLSDRFITQGVMPEKAIDLLDRALSSTPNKSFLLPEDIERTVEAITKIPTTKVGEEESEKLLKLEEILHKRIVNQEEAIKALADAMRRLRAGLHTGRRPIGSFLFLGPTGVGKTETAKALAETYFGSENNMVRFDMSEFQNDEGLAKLIGSYSAGAERAQGALAVALRKSPFALLLFDEFEKSSRAVVNLFLQILDEGFFTDAFGKKVSASETIIIATSNAGSNLIWELLKAGRDPVSLQKEVIDSIRKEGVFSPELLNRFDGIVVYHPLDKEKLLQVARILLTEFSKRLKEKDIEFRITNNLVEKIVEIGYDPVMGARPMRRAIAERVEQVVARKILEKKLERGSALEFTAEEVGAL